MVKSWHADHVLILKHWHVGEWVHRKVLPVHIRELLLQDVLRGWHFDFSAGYSIGNFGNFGNVFGIVGLGLFFFRVNVSYIFLYFRLWI